MRPLATLILLLALSVTISAQQQPQQFVAPTWAASQDELDRINSKLAELELAMKKLRGSDTRRDVIADVAIYSKAAEWIVRHGEFYNEKYAGWTVEGLEHGLERANELDERLRVAGPSGR